MAQRTITNTSVNQYSTVGAKMSLGAAILYNDRLVRLDCLSSYSDTDEDNTAGDATIMSYIRADAPAYT